MGVLFPYCSSPNKIHLAAFNGCLVLFLFNRTSPGLPPRALALTPPGQEPAGIPDTTAGSIWGPVAPAESWHLLSIMEEPTIKRGLKTVHLNTSVCEDVARCPQVQGYVWHTRWCHIKFKALRVSTRRTTATLHSGPGPQGCPFHKEMDQVLQIKISASPDNLRKQI